MTFYSETYRNQIVEAYQEVKDTSNESIIAFYERNRRGIELLDVDYQFEILTRYCKALFLTSNYHRHLHVADDVVEKSIFHNLQFVHGVDVYKETLFDKAASYYNLGRVDDSVKILDALVKMDSREKAYRYLLRRCYLYHKPRYYQFARALFILLILMSAFLIGIELIIIEPFAEQWVGPFRSLTQYLSILGISALALSWSVFNVSAFLRSVQMPD